MPMYMTRECFVCKHWRKGSDPIACEAFPDEIPIQILSGSVSHTKPYPGDGGMRYAPGEPAATQEVTR